MARWIVMILLMSLCRSVVVAPLSSLSVLTNAFPDHICAMMKLIAMMALMNLTPVVRFHAPMICLLVLTDQNAFPDQSYAITKMIARMAPSSMAMPGRAAMHWDSMAVAEAAVNLHLATLEVPQPSQPHCPTRREELSSFGRKSYLRFTYAK